MKVYKVFYADEYEHPDDIEIVSEKGIVNYANEQWREGRISQETIEIYLDKHAGKPETETDAVELLELDGYYLEKVSVYER